MDILDFLQEIRKIRIDGNWYLKEASAKISKVLKKTRIKPVVSFTNKREEPGYLGLLCVYYVPHRKLQFKFHLADLIVVVSR